MLRIFSFILIIFFFSISSFAQDQFWLEMPAQNSIERTRIIQLGFDIVSVESNHVIVLANEVDMQRAQNLGLVSSQFKQGFSPFDFPLADDDFHNYTEITDELKMLQLANPEIMELESIGQSVEGRDIWAVRISSVSSRAKISLPASVLMGGHHAREHVSVETPLFLLKYILGEYKNQNPRIVSLVNNYEVFIIPVVNPDGKSYDIASSNYKSWRKNRRKNTNGSVGVDLNRNYGFGWGGAGASTRPSSSTYRGPEAFSEPETQAIKNFLDVHSNIKTMVSYHTFGKLVLWPWGHLSSELSDKKDLAVFKHMGQKMGEMTGYKPMKSGDLYLASGDTCDWAYGEKGIFAFTFELDPESMWSGGFYPGQGVLQQVFDKNIEPALYLIESAQDPYQVIEK